MKIIDNPSHQATDREPVVVTPMGGTDVRVFTLKQDFGSFKASALDTLDWLESNAAGLSPESLDY